MIDCLVCHGTGKVIVTWYEGKPLVEHQNVYECNRCKGTGIMPIYVPPSQRRKE